MKVLRLLIAVLFAGAFSVTANAQQVGMGIGDIAPEINLPNTDGRNIPLSSLRGNIVLIDFWASWCVPCRQENPRIRRIYNRYNNLEYKTAKGFEIYGVSLDRNRSAWVDAISKDRLTWANVSDLQGWKSSAANTYRINAIPMNFIIDENGVIIARGLNSKAIEDLLDQLLK